MKIIKTIIISSLMLCVAIIVIFWLWLMIAMLSTDTKKYVYTDFRCKDQIFSIQEELEVSESNYLWNHYKPENQDENKPLNIYPIGSSFKRLRYYSKHSFSLGSSAWIVEDEDGYKSYFQSLISPENCQILYTHKEKSNRNREVLTGKILQKNDQLIINPPPLIHDENQKNKRYIHTIFNNKDTVKPDLKLRISNKSKYFHYTKKIIEKNIQHFKKYDLILVEDQFDVPIFQTKDFSFTPFSCKTDYTDMYKCFTENFSLWLNEPYKTSLPFPISTPEEMRQSIKNDNKFALVFYIDTLDFIGYSSVIEGIQKINQESPFLIPESIGNKIFLVVGSDLSYPNSKKKKLYMDQGVNIVSRDGTSLHSYRISPKLRAQLSEFSFQKACSDEVFKYDSIEKAVDDTFKYDPVKNEVYPQVGLLILFTQKKGCSSINRIVQNYLPKNLSKYNVVQLHEHTEEYNKYIKHFKLKRIRNTLVYSNHLLEKLHEKKFQ